MKMSSPRRGAVTRLSYEALNFRGPQAIRSAEAVARVYESTNSEVVAVNVHAGYAYADIADAGVSIDIIARTRGLTHAVLLEQPHSIMAAHASRSRPPVPGPDEVLASVSAANAAPIVIADPCDNVGAGAPGDTTGLLRAFLRWPDLRSLAVLCDPLAVSEYWSCTPPAPRCPVAWVS